MALRIMFDAAYPPGRPPAEAEAFLVYAGGFTPHPWTDDDIARIAHAGTPEAVPCWVYKPGSDGAAAGREFAAWLDRHRVPEDCWTVLDLEMAVDLHFIHGFDAQLKRPLALYGSTSTLFANPPADGWFPADWTGVPHLWAHADVIMTQFAAQSRGQTHGGPWDLDLVAHGAKLWVPFPKRGETLTTITTAGHASLATIAAGRGVNASKVLRLTAEHSPGAIFRPELARYINAHDLTAPMPAGITLWVPEAAK